MPDKPLHARRLEGDPMGPRKSTTSVEKSLISQAEVDELFNIHDLIEEQTESRSLIDEIQAAILDSGKLTLTEWKSLRQRIAEIEQLIPHMDLIIKLKETQDRRKEILKK